MPQSIGQGVGTARLNGGGQGDQGVFVAIFRGNRCQFRPSHGQGPCLINDQRIDLCAGLKRRRFLEQHALARRRTDGDHYSDRRRQAQSTGTGNDQHGNGVDRRCFPTRSGQQPSNQGHDGNRDHDWYEHGGNPVDHALYRRGRGLGPGHAVDNPAQQGMPAHAVDPHGQMPRTVDRTAENGVSGADLGGQTLARDHRRIDGRMPAFDRAVGGNGVAGADNQDIARHQGCRRNFDLVPIAQDPRGFGPQVAQGIDRRPGGAARAPFQPTPGHDEPADHRGRFEVQVPSRAVGPGLSRQEQVVEAHPISGECAHQHEQVHVADAGLQPAPGRPPEPNNGNRLDRRGNGQLRHRRQKSCPDRHVQNHMGQKHPGPAHGDERRKIRRFQALIAGIFVIKVTWLRLEPHTFQGLDQVRQRAVAAPNAGHVRDAAGEADLGIQHARNGRQRLGRARGATGAGHPLDGQLDCFRRDFVSGSGQGVAHGGQILLAAIVRRPAYPGRIRRQIYRHVRDPRHGGNRLLDTRDAGRAMHAFDRQCRGLGRVGNGRAVGRHRKSLWISVRVPPI